MILIGIFSICSVKNMKFVACSIVILLGAISFCRSSIVSCNNRFDRDKNAERSLANPARSIASPANCVVDSSFRVSLKISSLLIPSILWCANSSRPKPITRISHPQSPARCTHLDGECSADGTNQGSVGACSVDLRARHLRSIISNPSSTTPNHTDAKPTKYTTDQILSARDSEGVMRSISQRENSVKIAVALLLFALCSFGLWRRLT